MFQTEEAAAGMAPLPTVKSLTDAIVHRSGQPCLPSKTSGLPPLTGKAVDTNYKVIMPPPPQAGALCIDSRCLSVSCLTLCREQKGIADAENWQE